MDKLVGIAAAGLTEGLKEPVEEDLRLAFFVAGDVLLTPRGEFGEFFPARHGGVLHQRRRNGNSELFSEGTVDPEDFMKPAGHSKAIDLSQSDTLSTPKRWLRKTARSNSVQIQPIRILGTIIIGFQIVVIYRGGLNRLLNPPGEPFVNLGVPVGK